MADDPVLKMYEIQAELEKLKEESTRIQKQNNELKNQLVVNDLIQTVNDFQTNISTRIGTIQDNLNVLNHDQILSEINETLRKINKTLSKQNEIIQVLKTSVGNQSFSSPIAFSETETILLLGGEDGKNELDSLLILENNRNKWKELNIKLPYPVYSHGAQFLNNNLYIFGGENARRHPMNSTYKLSTNLQWEKMADMNQERSYISNSSVILNDQIWVCGGWDENGADLNTVEMYDPKTNKWKYMKQMYEFRSSAAAAVVDGKIFSSGYTSVECYDPSSDVWTLIYNMPKNILSHGAAEMDGNLIVMGGYSREHLKNVWALDTTDKNAEWIEKPSMSIPRRESSIAKIDGTVFVCGGYNEENLDSVEIFDGEVWRSGPKMPTPRRYAPAVIIPIKFAKFLK